MVAIAWLVGLEAVIAYAVPTLQSPVDVALLIAMLLLGTGAGYYGLMGPVLADPRLVRRAGLVRIEHGPLPGGIEVPLSVAPEALPLILIWVPMLPLAWMLSIGATQFAYWRSRWDDDGLAAARWARRCWRWRRSS